MKKIGIINIVTNKYGVFINEFYKSSWNFFQTEMERHYFLLTDNLKNLEYCPNNICNIHPVIIEDLEFDLKENFLHALCGRYHYISKLEDISSRIGIDYMFYFDIDLRCVDYINCEVNIEDKICVVEHPCQPYSTDFFGIMKPYEDNENCCGFVEIDKTKKFKYLGSAFLGGPTKMFFNLTHKIKNWANQDLLNNHINKWHDETYLNRLYIEESEGFHLLSPSYLFPEYLEREMPHVWKKISYKPIMIALDKDRDDARNIGKRKIFI